MKSAFFEGGGSLSANISGGRDNTQQPPLQRKDYRYSCFVWSRDIDRRLFRFVTICASDSHTDRQTDLREQYYVPCVALHAVAR